VARLVRSMYKDKDGFPLVGSHKRCLLGVRPTGANADVDLQPAGDIAGQVVSNHKGLSVVDDWRKLADYQIPKELDDGLNGASGVGMAVYVHGNGTGPFAPAVVGAGLEMILKAGQADAGVIRPVATVPLAQYQAALQATRQDWADDPS
jgi:hypothetical protein